MSRLPIMRLQLGDFESGNRQSDIAMPDYGAIIAGTGSFVPEKRLTNDDLSKMVDTNDEWIVQRTGIRERRIAGPRRVDRHARHRRRPQGDRGGGARAEGHRPDPRAARSRRRWSSRRTACFVAAVARARRRRPRSTSPPRAAGSSTRWTPARAFIKAGQYKNVLVIGAETLSRITDYKDRGSCILFGDGAGAVVLQRSNDPKRGVIYSSLHADGTRLGDAVLHARQPLPDRARR